MLDASVGNTLAAFAASDELMGGRAARKSSSICRGLFGDEFIAGGAALWLCLKSYRTCFAATTMHHGGVVIHHFHSARLSSLSFLSSLPLPAKEMLPDLAALLIADNKEDDASTIDVKLLTWRTS